MDRRRQLRQMTAEQFAAFDTQLYLDTHPNDRNAMQMFERFNKNYEGYKREYESHYGPVNPNGTSGGTWNWVDNPWPWEREAN